MTRSKLISGARVARGRFRTKRKDYSVDLPRHMAECDANYHRLMRLFPGLRDQAEFEFILELSSHEARVVFSVLERGPYTTLLHIDVQSDDRWLGLATAPEMTVRIYHDAQSAEVASYQNQNRFHGKYEYPNTRMRQRDEKVQLNRFLGEFLTLCMAHGASVQPVSF